MMMQINHSRRPLPLRVPHAQQGAVLLVAIVVLIAMTLAGLAMIRSVTAGQGAAGNLAFKQNATSVADVGVNRAVSDFLTASPATAYYADKTDDAYYASLNNDFDKNPSLFDWDGKSKQAASDIQGNKVRYVVHRLCKTPGALTASGQECLQPPTSGCFGGGTPGVVPVCAQYPVYRVTTRVDGVRGTVSYSQTIVY